MTHTYDLSHNTYDPMVTEYKFNGKEKDEETGMYYYGARFHAYRQAGFRAGAKAHGKGFCGIMYTK